MDETGDIGGIPSLKRHDDRPSAFNERVGSRYKSIFGYLLIGSFVTNARRQKLPLSGTELITQWEITKRPRILTAVNNYRLELGIGYPTAQQRCRAMGKDRQVVGKYNNYTINPVTANARPTFTNLTIILAPYAVLKPVARSKKTAGVIQTL